MKIKNLLQILVVGIVLFSCGGDDNDDNFDYEGQAETDNNDIVEYLQTHYLNEDDGAIWTITGSETSLMDDSRLSSQTVVSNDVSYKLYTLKTVEGVSKSPSQVDSVLVTYAGMLLDSTVFDASTTKVWFALSNLVSGWGFGLRDFKGGEVVQADDESFKYENSGQGYLFMPSGLGYGNVTQSVITKNSPLIFKITMNDVNYVDNDLDGVLSKDEDVNNDGLVTNDDTDGDSIPNYIDTDDDGDGILTEDELEDNKYLDPNN
ncbi:FKBP-type peptidyl-prolyl cis-trans isomerase [Lutibacter oricola]|uniref:Peptidyl-prolyl cis-trans isomerase n=1 Tax=Lutibacter oricola TaxID=762486 RepID=A0A1H2XLU1_9FLAO|nr:FKBP-type peptidyl-prolyl cis-trans isomerase [Lutibacter oricola]SDW93770.1 FKBP-type peptidyl-prolyl cis-trans isomerase [Lutibacter oricola]